MAFDPRRIVTHNWSSVG